MAILRFSDVELVTLADQWAAAEVRRRNEGGIRSITAFDATSQTGIGVVCSDQSPEDRRRSLASLCLAKKYESRATEWIGIGFRPASETPDVIIRLSGPWEKRENLEAILGQLKNPGKPS